MKLKKYSINIKNIYILFIFTFLFSVLLVNFVYANYAAGNPRSFIQNEYSSGQKIQGWINLSLTEQNAKSKISDSFGNQINLINLLNKNPGISYACNPTNCQDSYLTSDSGSENKIFNLVGEKTIGIVLNGKDVQVSSFSLSGSSSIGNSCTQQLSIDLEDDGTNDWGNSNYVSESCGSDLKSICNTGVFSESVSLSKVPYCEKMKLLKAPAFEINANVRKNGGSSGFYNGLLKGWIYDRNGELKGSCDFSNPSSNFGQINCIVNYILNNEDDHYICISYEEAATNPTGYDLQARLSGNYCGFLGDPQQTTAFNGDYNLGVSVKKFAGLTNFSLNDTSFINSQSNLVTYLNNYITTRYNGDCSISGGCIIPIKLSGLNQALTLNNLKVIYSSQGSAGTVSKLLYDTNKNEVKITSSHIKIDLGKGEFYIPTDFGNYSWKLFIDNQSFEQSNISISGQQNKIILQVYPREVPVVTPTTFIAFLDKDTNLTGIKLIWDFGDNTQQETTGGNKVKHTYANLGNYTLTVKAFRDDQQISSVSFNINTKSPKEVINTTILKYQKDISNTESQMNNLTDSYRKIVRDNYLSDLQQTRSALGSIDSQYKRLLVDTTTKDQDYITLMNSLTALKIPNSIQDSSISIFDYVYNAEDVDLEQVVKLFNDYYKVGNDEAYKESIANWYSSSVNVTLNHRIISIYYQESVDDVISEFNFTIRPKTTLSSPMYAIIQEDTNNLAFNGNYKPIIETGYTGIKLDDLKTSTVISFAIEGSVDSFELPVFIVPELKSLTIDTGGNNNGGVKKSFWGTFLPWFIVLLIIALVIYILLQEWYKRKYESHLFKDKNELYNLIFFIKNAKNKNLTDKQIIDQLKKTGWKAEKIEYALNKFYGKRTGMWEIPIFRWFEKRKMQKEMLKRQRPRTAY